MEHLSAEFWSERYKTNETGWDVGEISTPIRAYIDQLENKHLKILIPGCGYGHEAEYLYSKGFTNVHVIDLCEEPLKAFRERVPAFPVEQIHQGNFFEHTGSYDLIIEQTMFCAIDPMLREKYAQKVAELLNPGGKLVAVLFDIPFESGPPYGGNKEEYLTYFEKHFSVIHLESCYNSIAPRAGRELFMIARV